MFREPIHRLKEDLPSDTIQCSLTELWTCILRLQMGHYQKMRKVFLIYSQFVLYMFVDIPEGILFEFEDYDL